MSALQLIAKFATTLASGISTTSLTATLSSLLTSKGETVPDGAYGLVFDKGLSTEETVIGTLSGSVFTFTTRGVSDLDGSTSIPGNIYAHRKGASIELIAHPVFTGLVKQLSGESELGGVMYYPASRIISGARQLIDKEYADSVISSGISALAVSESTTALKINVNSGYYSLNGVVNFYTGAADEAVVDDATNYVQLTDGVLEINQVAFDDNSMPLAVVIAASGAITSLTDARAVLGWLDIKTNNGIGRDSEGIYIDLATDPGLEFDSGKLSVKLKAGGGLTLDSDGLAVSTPSTDYTADGDIPVSTAVKISAADTVKSLEVDTMATGAAITTSPSHYNDQLKTFALSTPGKYLHIRGGDPDGADTLYLQVRTLNAAEDDFANGTEVNTSSCTGFKSCQIGVDKFLLLYQNSGSKVRVITVSGTTVTVGAETSISSASLNARYVGCSKLDTDKAIIYYNHVSTFYTYAQVLTISGTTVTTNTPYLVNDALTYYQMNAAQLDTDKSLLVFTHPSTPGLSGKVITVDGTVVTASAAQVLYTDAGNNPFTTTLLELATDKILIACEKPAYSYERVFIATADGTTLTASSSLQIGTARNTNEYGMARVSDNLALVNVYVGATAHKIWFLDLSSGTPVEISSQQFSNSSTSHHYLTLCKVAPGIYMEEMSGAADGDRLIKMTVDGSLFGITAAAILDAAAGEILQRFGIRTISGASLTPGTTYYIDDDGSLTTHSSLASVVAGIAINTTDLLIQ